MAGKIPEYTIKYEKAVMKDKNSKLYKIWSEAPDAINGFKYVIKKPKKQKGGCSVEYVKINYDECHDLNI